MLDRLLTELSQRKPSELVFNQYQDIRVLNNLKAYITYLLRYNPNILLIGEAPGYRGCRLTGIPFTSGEVINNSKHTIFKELGIEIVPQQVISENTATILWEFLGSTKICTNIMECIPISSTSKW